MKKKFFLFGLFCVWCSQAQNITAAEYFFDADPGIGNGTAISVGAAGTTVNFTTSIPTSSLSNGFHTLAIRTKDANGLWGLMETRAMYITSSISDAPAITAAEYFIDADPGAGNGIALSIGASGNIINFTAAIPTTSLSTGFHTIAIRTRDANGVWGLFETRAFYISTSTADATAITAAEYLIDNDPGAGNGNALSIGSSGNVVNFTASIPTTSLANGFHTLAIRTKDASDKWGLFEVRAFYISTSTANAGAIVAAEYFIDADPGAGNGTSINISASGNTVNFTASIPTNSLSNGFHTLAIRTKNSDGVWGLFENRAFYISTSALDMGIITAAEYFIDTDPGVGNGSPLSVTTPGNTVNQTFLANVPIGTTGGTHQLAIRTRDVNGVWGLFEVREFTVGGALPLDWLSFTGRRAEQKVALKWITENEINTSHFDIERSKNGIDFTSIGRTTAQGGLRNNYSFEDVQPMKGLNYYRLKQIDRNGAFKYPILVKVFFGDAGMNDLRLFPQPVQSTLNVVFGGSGNSLFIHVYDAAGKIAMYERRENASTFTIETSSLVKGAYWIVVSDGITQQKGMFIKQ